MVEVKLTINGQEVRVKPGTLMAAAIERAGTSVYRTSVKGQGRGPLCGMGICYECRVSVNGQPHVLSCQTVCEEGMQVTTG